MSNASVSHPPVSPTAEVSSNQVSTLSAPTGTPPLLATHSPPPLPAAQLPHLPDPSAIFGTAQTLGLAIPTAPVAAVDVLNVKQHAKRTNKAREANLALRQIHWPDVKPDDLWLLEDGKRGGFAQVPRTLSILMNMINDIIKRRQGKAIPAGKTYLVLWLNVFFDGFLRIDDEREAAFAAGYEGERNVATFRAHMKILQDLGFIDFKAGHKNPSQYVLMLNPYKVVNRLYQANLIPTTHYTALLEKASAIGSAKELKE